MPSLRNPPKRLPLFALPLILVLLTQRTAIAQDEIAYTSEGTGSVRPIPCWTTTMEFYDPVAFPYFEVEGYYFDANPFTTKRWVGLDEMVMMSTRGSSLVDMSDRKVWTPTNILVNCFEISFFAGLYTQRFAKVSAIYGTVQDKALGCTSGSGGSDPFALDPIYDTSYDPYATSDSYSDCPNPDTNGGPQPGVSSCHSEWIAIDISRDGGLTWAPLWEGEALICD